MITHAIDTGPLVAFLNGNDSYHPWTKAVLDDVEPPIQTCEAVLSEALFLLRADRRGQDAVLGMLEDGLIGVSFRAGTEAKPIRRLMARYATVPMALADACLVRMSELDEQLRIITIDRDFHIYRRHGRQLIPVVMPPDRSRP